jgi:hypothetical protein
MTNLQYVIHVDRGGSQVKIFIVLCLCLTGCGSEHENFTTVPLLSIVSLLCYELELYDATARALQTLVERRSKMNKHVKKTEVKAMPFLRLFEYVHGFLSLTVWGFVYCGAGRARKVCMVRASCGWRKTEQEGIDAWNTRS